MTARVVYEDQYPAARCPLHREEPDSPAHLLRYTVLVRTRHFTCHTIHPEPEENPEDLCCGTLAAVARRAQSRQTASD